MFPSGKMCTTGTANSKAVLMSLSPKLVRSGRESPERLWACLRGVLRLAGVMTVPPVCFNELGRMLSIAVRNRG